VLVYTLTDSFPETDKMSGGVILPGFQFWRPSHALGSLYEFAVRIHCNKFQKEEPMWTKTTEGRELIQEISKRVVNQIAPEELDLFDELVLEYFQNPSLPDELSKQKDNPLGFGLGETLIAISPAAAAMVNAVLSYLMTEVLKTAQDESAELIKKKVKELFNPEKDNDSAFVHKNKKDIPPLTKEQLEQVRKLAIKQAMAFKVAPDKAQRMADSLIGTLALS
jgi:hypothetical protein